MSQSDSSSSATREIGPALSILGSLLPKPVVVVETDTLPSDELHPDELRFLETTRPRRRAEFLAGRVCARRALAGVGIHGFALLPDEHRAPIWPTDVTGSVTHTANYTAVAVARRADVPSLGIDVEQVGRLSEVRWPFVFTPLELTRLGRVAEAQRAGLAAALFGAKEAYYKCRYQVTREPIGFHDVEIVLGARSFEVEPGEAVVTEGRMHVPATGKFEVHGDWVFVAALASVAGGGN